MRKEIIITNIAVLAATMTSCVQTKNYDEYEVVKETYIHKYGVPVPANDWSSRGEDGKIVKTMKNGITVSQSYLAGALEGDTTYSFPHSSVIEKSETYAKNVLKKETLFYRSGVPMQETKYNEDGTKSLIAWYENGAPKSVEEYNIAGLLVQGEYYDMQHNTDGWVDHCEGMRVVRDAYGQLVSRETIQEGSMISRIDYHPNGAIKTVTPYKNGLIEGIRKSYLPAGEPDTIEEWFGGKQQGMTIGFVNGEKFSETHFLNGMKNGIERHFKEGNEVTEEIYWKNDVRHGPSVSVIDGIQKMEWYYEGQPVSRGNFEIMNRQYLQPQIGVNH